MLSVTFLILTWLVVDIDIVKLGHTVRNNLSFFFCVWEAVDISVLLTMS